MINLTSTTGVQSTTFSSRKTDFDALFRNRSVADLAPTGRFDKSLHRCMAVLTEDACCTECGKEFEP
jgi:hypothetical protein